MKKGSRYLSSLFSDNNEMKKKLKLPNFTGVEKLSGKKTILQSINQE